MFFLAVAYALSAAEYAAEYEYEKRFLFDWYRTCRNVTQCDFDFCPAYCPRATRCFEVCEEACRQGEGLDCALRLLGNLDKLCQGKPWNVTGEPWPESCGQAAVCTSCDGLAIWGCQRAFLLAGGQYHLMFAQKDALCSGPRHFPVLT